MWSHKFFNPHAINQSWCSNLTFFKRSAIYIELRTNYLTHYLEIFSYNINYYINANYGTRYSFYCFAYFLHFVHHFEVTLLNVLYKMFGNYENLIYFNIKLFNYEWILFLILFKHFRQVIYYMKIIPLYFWLIYWVFIKYNLIFKIM